MRSKPVGAIAVTAFASLVMPAFWAGAANPTFTVTMQAMAAASAPQGMPFTFKTSVSSPDAAAKQVNFYLQRPGSKNRIFFASDLAVIPPNGSADLTEQVRASQWFAPRGKYVITAEIDGALVGSSLTYTVTNAPLQVPVFENVTAKMGLTTTVPQGACGRWSSGAAWADVNGDGKLDLFVTRQTEPAKLYLQKDGRFVDATAASGIDTSTLPTMGASFADYNNDGRPDLFVAGDGQDRLYRNDGNGHFTDVTLQAGLVSDSISQSGSWVDYDNDGYLDLYVANHARCTLPSTAGLAALSTLSYQPDHLYHNNGNGTFTDVTSLLGVNTTLGAGFLGAWFDYNGDGRQDLYLANDYLGTKPDRNHLWRNDGAGPDVKWQFTDVSAASGTAYSINTMGVGIGDYDRDGHLDLALTNFAANVLLRNNGDGTFTNVAAQAGTARPYQQADQRGTTWGATFGDFNLDGWEDLYVGAGYLWELGVWYGERFRGQPNELFVNDRNGKFLDLSAPSRANDPGMSRGVAVADFDRDGRLDLLVSNQAGSPHLYRNITPYDRNHWLEVNTVGTVSNRDGCGAKLVLTNRSGQMVREVFCGSTSVSSSSEKAVHFGLGRDKKFSLEITWPSGTKQTFKNLKADRYVTIKEPKL